jgi:DNA polymerase III subunit delta'
VEAVSRHIARERAPHALLLLGPRGVGKATLAADLAAGLLCLEADAERRPCRDCRACRKVDRDDHPDLHRVLPEGAGEQIRIGQVQELASALALLPLEGRVRVAVIEAAHRLNPDAQNALLKTLEEPPPGACIVLCADEASTLLPTVVSRAARLRLSPLPLPEVTDLLIDRGLADPATARALAVAAGGRPGIAMRLAARPEAALGRGRIARRLLDLASAGAHERLSAASDLMEEGARLDAAVRGEEPSTARKAPPAERRRAVLAVLDAWRDVGRDLAVVALTGGRGVRDVDLLEDLQAAAAGIDAAALGAFLDGLDGLAAAVESYAAPELVLDVLLLRWPRHSPATGRVPVGERTHRPGAERPLASGT